MNNTKNTELDGSQTVQDEGELVIKRCSGMTQNTYFKESHMQSRAFRLFYSGFKCGMSIHSEFRVRSI